MQAEDRAVLIAAVSEMAVLRALQLAGSRILAKHSRSVRGLMKSIEPWSVHAHLRVDAQDIDTLLKGAWHIPVAVGLPNSLIEALDQHTRILLAAGIDYRRDDLLLTLSRLPEQCAMPWEFLGSCQSA